MQWKFLLGACLLTGALLLPHAPVQAVVGGMAIAGLMQWVWGRVNRDNSH